MNIKVIMARFLRYLRPKAETVIFLNGVDFVVGEEDLVI